MAASCHPAARDGRTAASARCISSRANPERSLSAHLCSFGSGPPTILGPQPPLAFPGASNRVIFPYEKTIAHNRLTAPRCISRRGSKSVCARSRSGRSRLASAPEVPPPPRSTRRSWMSSGARIKTRERPGSQAAHRVQGGEHEPDR